MPAPMPLPVPMQRTWRIVKSSRSATAFDGEGARLFGGRWNSPGTAMVYTAGSQSLAVLELLVLQASRLLTSFCAIPVDFDPALTQAVDPAQLPTDWRQSPAPAALQRIGDQWAAEIRSVVLQVPCAIVPDEANFLLNPHHPDFSRVNIGPPTSFRLDPRLEGGAAAE